MLAPLPVTNRTMMGNLSGEIALWPMTTRFGNIPEAGGDIGSESQCGKPVSDLKSSRSRKNQKWTLFIDLFPVHLVRGKGDARMARSA